MKLIEKGRKTKATIKTCVREISCITVGKVFEVLNELFSSSKNNHDAIEIIARSREADLILSEIKSRENLPNLPELEIIRVDNYHDPNVRIIKLKKKVYRSNPS